MTQYAARDAPPAPVRPAAPRRPRPHVTPRRGRQTPPLPPLLVLAGGLVLLLVAVARLRHSPGAVPVPMATVTPGAIASVTPSPTVAPSTARDRVETSAIAAKVAAITAPLQGTYGVWALDLSTGASFGQHAQQSFIAASVIKTYILTALYEEVAEGHLSLDDTMTTTAADIQDYGTGSIRYDPVGTTYTLGELARRAAKQSDNTAAFLLTKRLGQQAVQDRTLAWGMSDTSIADDRTTPADIGLLFARLAQRKLLPPQQSLELLGLLTDTDFEDRLPALLPSYAVISHKIGTEANGVINDAGVVALPTRSYVIAVLSDGTNADQAIRAEQQISAAVLDYEASLP